MEKFLGAFQVKTTIGQRNLAKEREKAVNGFRWQSQKQKELRDI